MIQSRNRVQKAAHEARLIPAALQTAELVNVVGSLGAGSKWKPVRASQYFDAWTGSGSGRQLTADDIRSLERDIEAGIQKREAVVIARRAKESASTSPETPGTA